MTLYMLVLGSCGAGGFSVRLCELVVAPGMSMCVLGPGEGLPRALCDSELCNVGGCT